MINIIQKISADIDSLSLMLLNNSAIISNIDYVATENNKNVANFVKDEILKTSTILEIRISNLKKLLKIIEKTIMENLMKTEIRKNWEDAFIEMHKNGDDLLTIPDVFEDEFKDDSEIAETN